MEKTGGWKTIEKWDRFHQQWNHCPSAAQPIELNANKVNVLNTSRWNSTGTSWKGFFLIFYRIWLTSSKVLKKVPWYGLMLQLVMGYSRKMQTGWVEEMELIGVLKK